MKINTQNIYDDYIKSLIKDRKELTLELNNNELSKKYMFGKISIYEHYIRNFTNLNYDDLINLERYISENSIKHLVGVEGLDTDHLRRSINVIAEYNKIIKVLKAKLIAIEDCIKSYNVFKNVIYKFNNIISDEIVYKGYTFYLGSGLGHLRIKKVNALFNKDGSLRVKKRINWNQSNIKKAEIIAKGGTPFKVLERDGREITKTNNGEMWYCYFENEWDYMWHWYKGECFNLNSPYYRFKPTIHNNTSRKEGSRMGNVNKLKQLVTSNSPLLVNFTEKIIERKKV